MDKPGQLLKQAREAKSLSVDVIAQRLRLEPKVVQALEEDNYDLFPATAYTRGYLRNFAKQVEIDPEKVIAAFNEVAADGPLLEPHVTQTQPQASSNDKSVKVVTYSIVIASCLLLLLWWNSQRADEDERVELTPINDSVESSAPVVTGGQHSLSLQNEQVQETDSEAAENNLSLEASEAAETSEPRAIEHDFGVIYLNEMPTPPTLTEPTQSDAEETDDLSSEPMSIDVAEQSAVEQTEPEADISTENTLETVTQDLSSPTLEAELANDAIKIDFSAESWVEIRDGTSSLLYSGLAQAGEQISVSGVMPYKVVVGRASSAMFLYQGEPLDLEPLTRGQVARFVIDETGAHR